MAGYAYNSELKDQAYSLRRSLTPEERHLWYGFLNSYPVRFRRQRPLGEFIVDFYCAKAKLVVEIDGSGHYTDAGRRYDALRTAYLESLGLRVVRFSNHDIEAHFDRTCQHIDVEVRNRISVGA